MNPIFLANPVHTLEDLARGILTAAYGPKDATDRPVPTNLDALADLLRETQVKRVVVASWRVEGSSTSKMRAVFEDEGVTLVA